MNQSNELNQTSTEANRQAVEELVERFEEAWEQGPTPDMAEYLPAEIKLCREVLIELVHIDLERRLKAGEAVRVEDYLRRFPGLAQNRRVVVDLIAAEFDFCRRGNPELKRSSYLERFPQYRQELWTHWQMEIPSESSPGSQTETALPTTRSEYPGTSSKDGFPLRPEIPGYEILEVLGRGGMGVVYKARQVALQRLVALKMILGGQHFSPEQEARFRTEALALARLQNPHIVQVHEIGTFQGQPYFSLEYIEGGSLARKLEGTPRSPKQSAQFVVALAQAIHAAHQAGIIHRDLKPANVLVTQQGTLKITDFGLAKKLDDDSAQTRTGQIMGTPSYMAPEQATGRQIDIGPRTDVYALGAILYEMLTGRPPFKGASVLETLDQVRHHEPVSPRQLLPELSRDLETICLKCLQKDPTKRYATGEDLAEDLCRFLSDEPIKARPVGLTERCWRWIKRYPAQAGLAAAVLFLVVATTCAALWYQEEKGRRGAEQAFRGEYVNKEVREAIQDAINQRRDLHAILTDPLKFHELLSDIDQWQTRVLGVRSAWRRAQSLATGSAELLDASLAENLKNLGDGLLADERDWVLVKELDEIRLRASSLVEGNTKLSALSTAAEKYSEILARVGMDVRHGQTESIVAQLASSPVRLVLVAILDDWAAKTQDRILLARIFAVANRVDSDPWRKQFRDPEVWNDQWKLEALAYKVRLGEQSSTIIRAIARRLPSNADQDANLLRKALLHHPQDFWLFFDLGTYSTNLVEQEGCYRAALAIRPSSPVVHNNLGVVLSHRDRFEEAIATCEKAIALDPKFAMAYTNLGVVLRKKGHLDEAIAAHEKAVALDPKYARAHHNLGGVLQEKGRLDEAIAACEKAIVLDPEDAKAYFNLGVALGHKGRLDEAIAACQKAIALDPEDAKAHFNLGVALSKRNRLDEAILAYGKAVALDPKYAKAHSNLGSALQEKGRLDEAIAAFEKVIALDPNLAKAHGNLGSALWGKGRMEEAIVAFEKAIALDPKLAMAHSNLGTVLRKKGRLDEAIAAFEKAIALDPKVAHVYGNLGAALWGKGRLEDAIAACEKAIALDPKDAKTHVTLGAILLGKRRLDEAIAAYEKAISLDPKIALAHSNLGIALRDKGRLEDAAAACEKAIALEPKLAEAHCNLGHILRVQGNLKESLSAFQRGHELGSQNVNWRYPSSQWVKDARILIDIEAKLIDVLEGTDPPRQAAELLALANMCRQYKKYFAAAARFYGLAFDKDPQLVNDPANDLRYYAACVAVLAAAGKGKDADKLPVQEKARLRRQGFDWLQADLGQWRQRLRDVHIPKLVLITEKIPHWQKDSDLAHVRDSKELAHLSLGEQVSWQHFWTDVDQLLKEARASFTEIVHKGILTAKEREQAREVKMLAGNSYLIEMDSTKFDTYLRLEDNKGKVLAENDDIAPNNQNSRLVFTPTQEGLYRIVATSFQQIGTGTYTITIRHFSRAKK